MFLRRWRTASGYVPLGLLTLPTTHVDPLGQSGNDSKCGALKMNLFGIWPNAKFYSGCRT
jgi:hypothetical protein